MDTVLSTITAYREERGWTEYQLAERSGLPQTTISSWYCKNVVPHLALRFPSCFPTVASLFC